MGGGGAVRAAAKMSGMGVLNGGIRRLPVMPPAEHLVRNATRPVSAILSSSSASSKTPSTEVSSMPRVIFEGVPNFQEAKEATADLKDVLDKVYLSSPKSTDFGDTFAADDVSVLSPLTNPELDSKSRVFFEATTPVPKNVLQAFKLLSESPEAQTVVASIASDRNVWNAMMDIPMVKDYLNDVPEPQSPKRFEESSDGGVDDVPEPDGGPNNTGMMQNIKRKVLEMVSNVSNFFQNIYGVSASDDISSDSNGNTKRAGVSASDDIPSDSNGNTKTAGATLMGLAVMVMLVILFKRV